MPSLKSDQKMLQIRSIMVDGAYRSCDSQAEKTIQSSHASGFPALDVERSGKLQMICHSNRNSILVIPSRIKNGKSGFTTKKMTQFSSANEFCFMKPLEKRDFAVFISLIFPYMFIIFHIFSIYVRHSLVG